MRTMVIVGAVVALLGIAGLVTGGFSFTREETAAQVGPLKLEAEQRETVGIPVWASGAALLIGIGLMGAGVARRR